MPDISEMIQAVLFCGDEEKVRRVKEALGIKYDINLKELRISKPILLINNCAVYPFRTKVNRYNCTKFEKKGD